MRFDEFRKGISIGFRVDKGKFSIAKLSEPPASLVEIFAIVNDGKEITVVAREGASIIPLAEEKYYCLITFDVNLPFELSGFISYLSDILTQDGLPIFVLSAYSTDHILVKEGLLGKAIKALTENGMHCTSQI